MPIPSSPRESQIAQSVFEVSGSTQIPILEGVKISMMSPMRNKHFHIDTSYFN